MAGTGSKFTRKMEQVIAALMTQRTLEDAARTSGVGIQTVVRWLKIPEFQDEYREARRAAFSQAIARLQQGSSAAATTLLKIMLDQNAPTSSRGRAAECVMNHTLRAIEIEDIEVRVSDLERAAERGR